MALFWDTLSSIVPVGFPQTNSLRYKDAGNNEPPSNNYAEEADRNYDVW